ncbi:peptidylprolyl isomerase [Verticiella sediminum]|uniref:peptidylprolyl isomerase n=1 Tax=Verticiella sediminum TaxID=1247510 RepID=UPI001FE54F0E|nr:peptidylprolyl isomerase [Verticiella sediminum]
MAFALCALSAGAAAQGLRAPGQGALDTGTPAPVAPSSVAPVVPPPAPQGQVADAIVAVVNNDVITRRELGQRVMAARASLKEQGIREPATEVLERQVLDRMITDLVQLQEADRAGVRVSDEQLEMAIRRIAEQNNTSVQQMRAEIESGGVSWNEYRAELRRQVRMNRVREQEVDRNIFISEAEVDSFLAEQAAQFSGGAKPMAGGNGALHLAQILVRVPEGSSPEQINALRQRAQQVLAQARSGVDFAQLAAGASDGDEALRGGDLGVRPTVGWPDLFLQATSKLQPGQVSDIVQSGNGFHILKVVAREGEAATPSTLLPPPGGPERVTQYKARHILMRVTPARSDEQARAQLQALSERATLGKVPFADLARQYSDDSSAPQGGDLGWVSPGETVPEFERAMQSLQPGQISEPIRSQFGWHLIQLEDTRVQDVGDQNRRMQARQILFQRKIEPAWEEWVGVLRSGAYIDNRLNREQL